MYKYKIYQITNSSKAQAMKKGLIPNFQILYAQIINNTNPAGIVLRILLKERMALYTNNTKERKIHYGLETV
jgi:hypothetical protein